MTIGIEDVHKPQTRSGHVIVLGCILLGIGDIQSPLNVLDTEGGKTGRKPWVAEASCERHVREARVKDIHSALAKVGSIEETGLAIGRQGKPLIDRARITYHGNCRHGGLIRWRRPGSN